MLRSKKDEIGGKTSPANVQPEGGGDNIANEYYRQLRKVEQQLAAERERGKIWETIANLRSEQLADEREDSKKLQQQWDLCALRLNETERQLAVAVEALKNLRRVQGTWGCEVIDAALAKIGGGMSDKPTTGEPMYGHYCNDPDGIGCNCKNEQEPEPEIIVSGKPIKVKDIIDKMEDDYRERHGLPDPEE